MITDPEVLCSRKIALKLWSLSETTTQASVHSRHRYLKLFDWNVRAYKLDSSTIAVKALELIRRTTSKKLIEQLLFYFLVVFNFTTTSNAVERSMTAPAKNQLP